MLYRRELDLGAHSLSISSDGWCSRGTGSFQLEYSPRMTWTAGRAQTVVGLGGLALLVVGPLSWIPTFFVASPLDLASRVQSLVVGGVVALIPLAGVAVLAHRKLLDPAQMWIGGAMLLVGTSSLVSNAGLLLNGAFDGAEPERVRARVARFWTECSDHRAQNSTTTIRTCRNRVDLEPSDEVRPFFGIELPDGRVLHEGDVVEVEVRPGAFGWRWGARVLQDDGRTTSGE